MRFRLSLSLDPLLRTRPSLWPWPFSFVWALSRPRLPLVWPSPGSHIPLCLEHFCESRPPLCLDYPLLAWTSLWFIPSLCWLESLGLPFWFLFKVNLLFGPDLLFGVDLPLGHSHLEACVPNIPDLWDSILGWIPPFRSLSHSTFFAFNWTS